MIRPVNIQIEHMREPAGIDCLSPIISWNVEGGNQSAYRIVLKREHTVLLDTEIVESNQMFRRVSLDGKVSSGDRIEVSVQLFEHMDEKPVEETISFEYGLFQQDWSASWINPELVRAGKKDYHRPVSYLRKTLIVREDIWAKKSSVRVYATAHGVYSLYINGTRVEEFLMAPGVSQSDTRIQYQTYSIEKYLQKGENEILVTLSDGWWRGTCTFNGIHNGFGRDIAFLMEVRAEGRTICRTDHSWEASQNGPLRYADNMQGEEYDANMEEITDWHQVKVLKEGYDRLYASNCPPMIEHEELTPVLLKQSGEMILDFGQNIAGYISFSLQGQKGQKITFTHGETLDKDGKVTLDNFQSTKYRCEQKIEYICKEGLNVYKPTHTYMGFRYVKVEGMETIDPENFKAHAIYTDLPVTAEFSCGNEKINQLFQNAVWSLKGNLQDIPTDCPTREKGAFSGDLQAFSHTMMYLMESYPMMQKFIDNQAAGQWKDGCVRQIVADPRKRGLWDGAAGWCDSFYIIPENLGKRYQEYGLFERYYDQIKKWVDFLLNRAHKTRLKNRKRPYHKYYVDKGIHWGEWLEPDVDTMQVMGKIFKDGAPEVATAYLAYACETLADQALRMGKTEDAKFYREEAENAKKAYHAAFLPEGEIKTERMCQLIRPIVLNILTDEEKEDAAAKLNQLVIKNKYHLNTGFLTTHELLRTLSDYGYVETAYRLLYQEDSPGWLYAVNHGATTIWENWNGLDEQGNPKDSYNHYSYGAVVGWLLDSVCGIRVKDGKIQIRPLPYEVMGEAKGTYQSPFGSVSIEWKFEGENVVYEIMIPDNCDAEITFADGTCIKAAGGIHTYRHRKDKIVYQER